MSGPLAAPERIERLLAALDRALAPGSNARARLVARLLDTTGLSLPGIEWALAHCLERAPSRAERLRLVGSVARAPRAHVILPGSVFVAAHRALALGLAAAPQVFVKPSRRDPALIEALHARDPQLFQLVQRVEPRPGDHVFAYGSDVTLEALRRELPEGSVLHAHGSGFGVVFVEERLPVRDSVRSVCEMLGYDPYFLACEGRVVAVVAAEQAERALAMWQSLPSGRDASIVGHVQENPARLVLKTSIGGERVIEELEDDPLPRIC